MASSSLNLMRVNLPLFLPSSGSGLSAFPHVNRSSSRRERLPGTASTGGLKVRAISGPKYKGTQMRERRLAELVEAKVNEAKEVCKGDAKSDECKVAWDEVEEVSQAKADLRLKLEVEKLDPLESFCQDNPETEECRVYED